MGHKHDKQAIEITYKPVHLWDATDEQREELEKPNNDDETNVLDDEDIKQELAERLTQPPKQEEKPKPIIEPSLQKMFDDILAIKAS